MARIVGFDYRNVEVSSTFVEKKDDVAVEIQAKCNVSLIYCDEYKPSEKGKNQGFKIEPILKELDVEFNGLDVIERLIKNLSVVRDEMLHQLELADKFLTQKNV